MPDEDEPANSQDGAAVCDHRVLGNLFRGRRAAEALEFLTAPATADLLELDWTNITQIDAYGAGVIRTATDLHLGAGALHRVTMLEPATSDVWPFVSDAIGRLSAGCEWAGNRSAAARGQDVLIPAMPVGAQDITLMSRYASTVASALGHSPRTGRLLREAAAVFMDNVVEHAGDAPTPAVICAAFEPISHDLQLVCVNLAGASASLPGGASDLEEMTHEVEETVRSLARLAVSRRDLDFTIQFMSGMGRARHRTNGGWAFSDVPTAIPGFVAGIEIHQ